MKFQTCKFVLNSSSGVLIFEYWFLMFNHKCSIIVISGNNTIVKILFGCLYFIYLVIRALLTEWLSPWNWQVLLRNCRTTTGQRWSSLMDNCESDHLNIYINHIYCTYSVVGDSSLNDNRRPSHALRQVGLFSCFPIFTLWFNHKTVWLSSQNSMWQSSNNHWL